MTLDEIFEAMRSNIDDIHDAQRALEEKIRSMLVDAQPNYGDIKLFTTFMHPQFHPDLIKAIKEKCGNSKIHQIKEVRALRGLGLQEAKDLVESWDTNP